MIKNPRIGQLVYFEFNNKIVSGKIDSIFEEGYYVIRSGDFIIHHVHQEDLFARKDACKKKLNIKFIDEIDKLYDKIAEILDAADNLDS